jgi:hypothetical protein
MSATVIARIHPVAITVERVVASSDAQYDVRLSHT